MYLSLPILRHAEYNTLTKFCQVFFHILSEILFMGNYYPIVVYKTKRFSVCAGIGIPAANGSGNPIPEPTKRLQTQNYFIVGVAFMRPENQWVR